MTSFLPSAAGPTADSRPYDNLYVSTSNSMTSSARVFTGQCAKVSLPSKTFSAQVQVVNLPQNMLLGHTQLVLKVPTAAVPDNAYLLPGWINQAVQYYEFVFSDSERLRIDGPQLLIKNMADCESGEKKQMVMALSEPKLANAINPDKAFYTASLSIYLPFSNLSASRVHPFPADILERPVQLTIAFNPWIDVLQYVAADRPNIQTAINAVGGYADSYVMVKTMYMLDPSDSMREEVSLRGDSKYVYPYIYPQSFSSSAPIRAIPSSGGPGTGVSSVNLTRFFNANLQSIDLFLLRLSAGNTAVQNFPADSLLSQFTSNQNYFSKMVNCRLSYAGQTIWRSDDNSDQLMNLSEYPTTTSFVAPCFTIEASGTDPTVSTNSGLSSWVHIQLSQLNERFYSDLSQVGPQLNSNEVLFEFNVVPRREQETYGRVQDFNINPLYRLYAVYNYAAGVRVAKGAANLVFQPELQVLPSISGMQGTLGI
jgi:hypothetical protein